MTTITKEERVLKDIVVEKIGIIKQRTEEVQDIVENTARDLNELVSRAEDPQEKEELLLLLKDLENNVTLDLRKTVENTQHIMDRLVPGQMKIASLLKMEWKDIEKTVKRFRNGQ